MEGTLEVLGHDCVDYSLAVILFVDIEAERSLWEFVNLVSDGFVFDLLVGE